MNHRQSPLTGVEWLQFPVEQTIIFDFFREFNKSLWRAWQRFENGTLIANCFIDNRGEQLDSFACRQRNVIRYGALDSCRSIKFE